MKNRDKDIHEREHWFLDNGFLVTTLSKNPMNNDFWIVNQVDLLGNFVSKILIDKKRFKNKISSEEAKKFLKKIND